MVDYDTLLDLYWSWVGAAIPSCTQYAPIIFWHDEEQREAALASAEERGNTDVTVRAAEHFYPAEDYHQKYDLKRYEVVYRDFERMYEDHADIVRSTAAARCNGILSGAGSREKLGDELDSYGLSAAARQELEKHLR